MEEMVVMVVMVAAAVVEVVAVEYIQIEKTINHPKAGSWKYCFLFYYWNNYWINLFIFKF
jgi:hypothetical protein